jgi:hypothetical protein
LPCVALFSRTEESARVVRRAREERKALQEGA